MIIVDDREMLQHPDIPSFLEGVPLEVQRLEGGDFAFINIDGDPIAIERSEIGNLRQKLHTGELEAQLRKCADMYSRVYLIVEGVFDATSGLVAVHKHRRDAYYYRAHIYPNTRYDYIASVLVRLSMIGVIILSAPNLECTLHFVRAIYSQENKTEEEHTLFKKNRVLRMPSKITNNPAIPRLMGLCDRMPEKTALRLINKFGSVWGVLNASDKELQETDGVGKTLVKKLRRGVGQCED